MTTASPIPASLATACAAHDRHRLDVLDALLDEAAPSAVRELLGAALDLCASLRADLASERAHLAACKTRIAGLEQATNERSRTGQMSEPERSEWIGAAVAVADALGGSLGPVAGASGTIDPREWIHFAAGLADRAKKLAARAAKLEWERSRVADAAAESFHHGAWLRLMTAIDPNATITDDALRSLAERTTAQVTADREVARLAARVAELETRPVVTAECLALAIALARRELTDEASSEDQAAVAMRHLSGALPPQDRAEELTQAIHGTPREEVNPAMWRGMVERTRSALTSLGAPPTSPPAARPVFAGVSEEELALEYARAVDRIPGIRAVLDRLEVSLVAPVDPIALALNFAEGAGVSPGTIQRSRAEAAMRAALTAAGIPVTPEVGK